MHRDDLSSGQDFELISKGYYDLLMAEKIHILNVVLPDIRKKIQKARELGDLSENAEFVSELSNKARNEARLEKIKAILNTALVFDMEKPNRKDAVYIGAHVKIVNIQNNAELTFQIVSKFEVNATYNRISYKSDIAKVLIGQKVNNIVEFRDTKYKIVYISYEQ